MRALGHLRLAEITLAPGEEWLDETETWRFLRLSRGAAYWIEAARPRIFAERELLVLAPRAHGLIRASQLSEVVLHGFGFAPDLLCGFFTLTERHFLETGGATALGAVQFLPSTHPVTQRFAELAAARASEPDLVERVELLCLVATVFGERMAGHRPTPSSASSAENRFQKIVAQMPDMEMINHTPEELARLCGCSPRHFTRLFRKHFGDSPRSRQTEMRLLKASHLLTNTDEKIHRVALESGYHSLSLFDALFKKRFGMSPSDWRKKG
jgi:AraC-like DNA-binding protein